MTMKRLSLGLLMTILVAGAIAPMAMPSAFATTQIVSSAEVTSSSTVVITFDGSVDWLSGDFSTLVIDSESRTIDSVSGTSPSPTATINFSGGSAITTASTGTVAIATIEDIGSTNNVVAVPSQSITDGQAPNISSVVIGTSGNAGYAKSGDVITVTVTGDENLDVTAQTINGLAATITDDNTTTPDVLRTVDGTDAQGTATMSISVQDSSGNAASTIIAATSGVIVVDTILPVVTPSTTNITDGGNTEVTATNQYSNTCIATDTNASTCTLTNAGIDTSVLGTQTATYTSTDLAGNVATTDLSAVTTVSDTVDPVAPTLTSPADVSSTSDDTPSFVWSVGTDITLTSHRIDIDDTDNTFASIVQTDTGDDIDTGYTATTLADGTYYWRVVSIDGANNEGVSATRSFTIDTTGPVPTSVDMSNDDGSYPTLANVGDTVTITITNGETLTITGTPTIGGQTASIGTNNANIVTVTRVIDGSESQDSAFSVVIEDALGNDSTITAIAGVGTAVTIDTVDPVITLNAHVTPTGTSNVNIIRNVDTYTEPDASVTEGLTATITGDTNPNESAAVSTVFTIDYDATDLAGNTATTVQRTVTIVAGGIPVINDAGTAQNAGQALNYVYSVGNFTATDTDIPTDLTSIMNIAVESPTGVFTYKTGADQDFDVTLNELGSWTISANVTDASLNFVEVIDARTITVGAGNFPVITNFGSSVAISHNDSYTIATANCNDTEDGNIDGNVVVTGSVGSNAGDYPIEFSCTDSSGNTTVETITITRNQSGGGDSDHEWMTAPTFGIDWNTQRQLVEEGITFNHNSYDITDNFHTDFNRQHVIVGNNNIVAMKVYAPYEIKWVEFIFDIPEVGAAHKAKSSVVVPFDWVTNDIAQDKVYIEQDIRKIDLINKDKLEVVKKMTQCTSDDVEERCYLIAAKINFNEQPESGVFAIKAVDERNRSTTTYLNDGIEVTGDSLNAPETVLVSSPDRDHRGLVQLTQVGDRYDNLWASEDGYTYTVNQFGTFILVDEPEKEVRVDSGDPRTRTHSAFNDLKTYESEKAKYAYWNGEANLKEDKPTFSYELPTEDSRTQFLKQHSMLEFVRGQ